jgi:tetratricopeptide (TPR) repeat protein
MIHPERTSTEVCAAQNVHWIVPRPVNSLFTGRSELVERIKNALHNNIPGTTAQKRLVITGIGGIGKSEVCLKVADLMRDECVAASLCYVSACSLTANSLWGIFWVDVGSRSTAKNGFLAIAKALGFSAESVEESLQALASTKDYWLLILDNADDPEVDYAAYIPSGNQGAVLITSRIPECHQHSTVPAEALEGLNEEHSTQLLLKATRMPEEFWQSCEEQAQAIVALLGSHTLALIQAGAYIAEGYCRLDQYAEKYKRLRKQLLKHHPKQQQSRYRHVYATFEASVAVLNDAEDEAGQDALDLLGVFSMLHSGVLPLGLFREAWKGAEDVLATDNDEMNETDEMYFLRKWHVSQLPKFIGGQAAEWDDYRLNKASALLVSLSLITKHRSDGLDGLSMHPLAHAWARDRLGKDLQEATWVRVGCLLALSLPYTKTWLVYEMQLRPHLQYFLSPSVEAIFSFGPQGTMLLILLKCGWALNVMREDGKLESLLQGIYRVLHITPLEPSDKHIAIWDLAARNLGYMGDARRAAALLEHVVKIQGTSLAETDPDRLASQHALASAYHANGQIKDAIVLLEHVVKVEETTLAETHADRLASQHELARAYRANGQMKDAVALLEHVVKVEETTLAETHPDRLASQHALAIAYYDNGQIKDAVALLEHVVKIERTTLAETHPSRLASQHELASAYRANGQIKDAVVLLEHVVKMQETLAETHPDQLASQYSLALAYNANGQIKEAVVLLEHVVKVEETTLVETHPDRLASQYALALAYDANGQPQEALLLFEHVVAVGRRALGDNNPWQLIFIESLQRLESELAIGK